MALTGREVGHIATAGGLTVLLGLLVVLGFGRDSDDDVTAGGGAGGGPSSEQLEFLPTSPSTGPAPRAPERRPVSTPSPTARPTTVPTAGPTRVVIASPRPLARTPSPSTPPLAPAPTTPGVTTSTTAPPSSTPSPVAGRVRLGSALPPGCDDLGAACRYPDAPSGSQLSSGPSSVTVTVPGPGKVRITAVAGSGGRPGSVGFVVRLCSRCDEPAASLQYEARFPVSPGSSLELDLPEGRDLTLWVQELNEAGLSRGPSRRVSTAPAPSASAQP